MPELPEVETVVRGLKAKISGHKIMSVFSDWPNIIKNTELNNFKKQITGLLIEEIKRHGKYIIIELSGQKNLIIHLKMTGNLIVSHCFEIKNNKLKIKSSFDCPDTFIDNRNKKHIHFSLGLDKNKIIIFYDIRKFGSVRLLDRKKTDIFLETLGPDAIDKNLTLEKFKNILKKSNQTIKKTLLYQKNISGIGNIYADEILFLSRINPKTKASLIKNSEFKLIFMAMRKILNQAIEMGGTTFSDFKNTEGETGNYYNFLKVYQRENKPCNLCQTNIKRTSINNRSSFFCPKCQGKNK